MILKIIPVGSTATANRKNPDIAFRWKGQGFLLLPTDHVSLDFFQKKITITCNTFLYKPGRKITSSGNGMCREAVIQVDGYGACTFSKHVCPLNVVLLSLLHSILSHPKTFMFKVRSHLVWPVAEQRQEEEECHSFQELNCWAASGCSRKPTCLDTKT